MKKHTVLLCMILFIAGSCHLPTNLTTYDQLEHSPYGSYIVILLNTNDYAYGELIAVDSSTIYILPDVSNKKVDSTTFHAINDLFDMGFSKIDTNIVSSYEVYYAKPRMHFWSIPIMTLSTFTHGYYLVITAPLNILGTIVTSARGISNYRLTKKKLPMDELYKFARYPQGLPH